MSTGTSRCPTAAVTTGTAPPPSPPRPRPPRPPPPDRPPPPPLPAADGPLVHAVREASRQAQTTARAVRDTNGFSKWQGDDGPFCEGKYSVAIRRIYLSERSLRTFNAMVASRRFT